MENDYYVLTMKCQGKCNYYYYTDIVYIEDGNVSFRTHSDSYYSLMICCSGQQHSHAWDAQNQIGVTVSTAVLWPLQPRRPHTTRRRSTTRAAGFPTGRRRLQMRLRRTLAARYTRTRDRVHSRSRRTVKGRFSDSGRAAKVAAVVSPPSPGRLIRAE